MSEIIDGKRAAELGSEEVKKRLARGTAYFDVIVKGHWIDYTATRSWGETCYYRLWRCSNCGATLDMDEDEITEEHYCYNCGADMREGDVE